MKKIAVNKSFLLTILAYVFFLLTLPSILRLVIPCLDTTPGQSFDFNECNLGQVMNVYLVLEIAVLALFFIIQYVFARRQWLRHIIIGICLTVPAISAFLLYLPALEREVKNAPIILTTIPKPQ